jgi:hypothetical protein
MLAPQPVVGVGPALRCDCCRLRPAEHEDERRPAVLCRRCYRRMVDERWNEER